MESLISSVNHVYFMSLIVNLQFKLSASSSSADSIFDNFIQKIYLVISGIDVFYEPR